MDIKVKQMDMGDMEVDSAVRTLMEAEEIKSNPEMMKKVLAKLEEKKKAITSIEQLKAKAKEVMAKDEMEMEDESEDEESSEVEES